MSSLLSIVFGICMPDCNPKYYRVQISVHFVGGAVKVFPRFLAKLPYAPYGVLTQMETASLPPPVIPPAEAVLGRLHHSSL